uniref:DHH family phosphohydrolase n=1 Tax=Marseillevirus LCMAC101 TaxID=2506602 RepID=A0A481YR33_9VIRU|nr:MAG: DHH family phosphohydrolase [Marseillevirus LCMAC101]
MNEIKPEIEVVEKDLSHPFKHWLIPTEIDVVLYHASCPDGTGAAWPLWRENMKSSVPFQAYEVRHGEPYPDVTGKTVAIVDFSYKRSIMKDICKAAKYVRVIDHHKTAIRDLEKLEEEVDNYIGFFDVERSGAQLVWDLVYPSERDKRPWFIDIIADRDLWKWEIPNSKYIGKALYHRDWYTFQKMEYLMGMDLETTKILKDALTAEGRFISAREKKDIDYACGTAILCEFQGYKVKLSSCHPTLRSEVGNILSNNGCDFAVTWRYDFQSDSWWISLRGSSKSPLDLAKICEKFGGGGHPKACGFTIHGEGSKIWKNASDEQRKNLAFGGRGLHSYFMIHN